jgi:FdhE protein
LATPIITDGSTERVQHAPRVVLPNGALFADRALRFEALARDHALGDYLRLMAAVARAQHVALATAAAQPVDAAALAGSRDYGMPPLSAQSHARAAQWRADLQHITRTVAAGAAAPVAATLAQLQALDETALESLADRVLAAAARDDEAAAVPFVGAALQVYFTRQAAALALDDVSHCDVATVCPVCASRPVASVVRIEPARANLRYLVCSLCSTEWHMVRVKCSSCEEDKGVGYLSLAQASDAARASVRAEVCDACRAYLKIMYQEHDPQLDPTADDLATLALDVLVDERGYARSGPNLLFHPGSG